MPSITSIDELRTLYAQPTARVVKKQIDHLDRHCRNFIALSPFVVMSTVDADGNLDTSPRGGEPGFIRVMDERTLLIPDRPGNNRLDSFRNIIETGKAGFLFMIPGVTELLRVNGRAELRTNESLKEMCVEQDKLPKVVLSITVLEAFLHCAKAIMRSALWKPESQINPKLLPTMGEMMYDITGGIEPLETPEAMLKRHQANLY